jgi:hypothetical protein
LGAVAGRDGQDVGGLFDFEAVPAVAGHDGRLAGEESDDVVGRTRLVGAEVETNRAAHAAHRLVGERVLLPVIGVDVVIGLGVEDRQPPLGAAVCKQAFGGANGLRDSKWRS